ncbi:MAG: hypothetical protein IPL63_18120 [Saprospiraceae bacterium]|nr:hypothetical protein [Saprospiraceae bacterium]MBK8855406.1 hypothetical protein [Saprospiraceae bacterium]
MKLIYFIILPFLITGLTHCGDKENGKTDKECPDNLACTEIFVTVSVPLIFKNHSFEELARSETSLVSGNEIIFVNEFSINPGSVIQFAAIVNDMHLKKLKKEGSEVIFIIFDKNNKKIFEEKFIIGHDCCHVEKRSGPEEIIL